MPSVASSRLTKTDVGQAPLDAAGYRVSNSFMELGFLVFHYRVKVDWNHVVG